ncbi:MAG: hypothetical protein D6702_10235, partial [Planctomycetota bacterium]
RRIDPVPARLAPRARLDWLWREIERADPARAALLTGRLLAEIPAGNAPADRRIGLVELRRALRRGSPSGKRAAAAVAAHQLEPDLVRPLAEVSLAEEDPGVRRAAAAALLGIDEDRAVGAWARSLLRGGDRRQRARAAENLGASGSPRAVDPLMLAVASAARAPGRYVFFGRQVSLVTDLDVEVARAAAIADPVVNVLTEGSVLEVRLVSTFTSRAAMRGLRRLTGADPGPGEADWLRWYEERRAGGD